MHDIAVFALHRDRQRAFLLPGDPSDGLEQGPRGRALQPVQDLIHEVPVAVQQLPGREIHRNRSPGATLVGMRDGGLLVRVSAQQAAITHADERCTWGSVAVNLAARELLHGNRYFVDEVLHRLQGAAPRPLLEAIRRVPWEEESALPIAVQGEYGYVVHCVEIAIWCAVHRPSLEEALIFLAEAGGDTDTNAAVAGALLGARDGEAAIPPRWLDQLGAAKGVATLAERLMEAAAAS